MLIAGGGDDGLWAGGLLGGGSGLSSPLPLLFLFLAIWKSPDARLRDFLTPSASERRDSFRSCLVQQNQRGLARAFRSPSTAKRQVKLWTVPARLALMEVVGKLAERMNFGVHMVSRADMYMASKYFG